MKQYKRSTRLGEQLRRDLSDIWERDYAEITPGMLSFTQVRLTDDLRYATVYYSHLGTEEQRAKAEELLQREAGSVRHKVGKGMRVRRIPEFSFKFDPSIEEGIRIEKLLNEIKASDEAKNSPE
jgi:ribosome-binding factor A